MGSFSPGTLFRTTRSLLAVTAMVVALSTGTAEHATAQGAVKSVHNDWQVRCDTPPGAQGEQCALIQSVTAEDRANVSLTVIVVRFVWVFPATYLPRLLPWVRHRTPPPDWRATVLVGYTGLRGAVSLAAA